jgi:hypothetical protein
VEYCGYVAVQSQSPFDAHYLESAMVHFAWRVQHGIRLYPDWESYPHVANFFSPLSFLIIGLIGRAIGTDFRGLYLVGRGVSIVSVVATSIVLGVVLKRRYGLPAAFFGILLSLGACPLYAAGVMTRPDALAEFLGTTGFFLAEGRSRSTGIAAGLTLCLAAMTKQTTLVYFGAAAVSLCLKGQWRRALILTAGVTTTILVTVAVVQRLIEPNLVRSLLGESRTPRTLEAWWATVSTVVSIDPELFVLAAAGVFLWITDCKREYSLAALALVILTAELLIAAKRGSAPNYFLGACYVSALAGGAFWFEMTQTNARPKAWQLFAAVGVGAGLMLSTKAVNVYLAVSIRGVQGAYASGSVDFAKRVWRAAESSKERLLTDDGEIDIRRGDNTVFADPWLFRLMVQEGQIDPRRMRRMISEQYYDRIITRKNLFSQDYLSFDRGLPVTLVEEARLHYEPTGERDGLFFYGRRARPSSH